MESLLHLETYERRTDAHLALIYSVTTLPAHYTLHSMMQSCTATATIYEAVCRTMMARIMFCTVSLKIVTTQNGLPQKSTTMKLTRMVFAKLHVPSTPMWPQCMAGKLYRTTSFR